MSPAASAREHRRELVVAVGSPGPDSQAEVDLTPVTTSRGRPRQCQEGLGGQRLGARPDRRRPRAQAASTARAILAPARPGSARSRASCGVGEGGSHGRHDLGPVGGELRPLGAARERDQGRVDVRRRARTRCARRRGGRPARAPAHTARSAPVERVARPGGRGARRSRAGRARTSAACPGSPPIESSISGAATWYGRLETNEVGPRLDAAASRAALRRPSAAHVPIARERSRRVPPRAGGRSRRVHVGPPAAEARRQRPDPGADLERDVLGAPVPRAARSPEDVVVDQEALPEPAIRPQPELGQPGERHLARRVHLRGRRRARRSPTTCSPARRRRRRACPATALSVSST